MRSATRTLAGGTVWCLVAAATLAQTAGPRINPATGLKNYGQALFGAEASRPTPQPQSPQPAPRVTVSAPTPTPVVRQAAATTNEFAPTVTADYAAEAGASEGAIVPVGATDPAANPFAAFEQTIPTTAPAQAAPVVPTAARVPAPASETTAPAVAAPPVAKPVVTVTPPVAVAPPVAVQPPVPTPVKPTLPQPTPAAIAPTAPVPAAALIGRPAPNGIGAKIKATWERDGDVHVGEPSTFRLVVQNIGDGDAAEVTVDATVPASLELTDLGTAASAPGGFKWNAGPMAAGALETLTLTAIPSARGEIDFSALVTTRSAATETFAVAEPLVEVTVEGPEKVMIGDPAPYTIVVKNPGTGTADDITIEAIIPAGLEHSKGQRLAMGIGSLTPGESRVIRLPLTAVDGGDHAVSVVATAGERLRSDATASVFIVTPSLKLALDGPGLRYVGRTATYTLTVTNDGSAPNSNVRVTQQIPDGFAFVRADRSGRFDSVTRQAKWFLGRMEAGETRELKLELSAEKLGSFVHQAATISEHGARSSASVTTHVDGTSSLTLQIVDLDDPVEVGSETAYEIRVKNEGTKAAANVATSCKLPSGVTLVDAGGATPHRVDGSVVTFRPLDTLRAGQTVNYRVRVRGSQAGNQRFRVRLSSDSVTEPLIFEELTKFYKD